MASNECLRGSADAMMLRMAGGLNEHPYGFAARLLFQRLPISRSFCPVCASLIPKFSPPRRAHPRRRYVEDRPRPESHREVATRAGLSARVPSRRGFRRLRKCLLCGRLNKLERLVVLPKRCCAAFSHGRGQMPTFLSGGLAPVQFGSRDGVKRALVGEVRESTSITETHRRRRP